MITKRMLFSFTRLAFAFWCVLFLHATAWCVLEVDVTEGTLVPNPLQIALKTKDTLSQGVASVIAADLSSCGVFRQVGGFTIHASVTKTTLPGIQRSSGAHFLIFLDVSSSRRECRVRAHVYDLLRLQEVCKLDLSVSKKDWRRAAHQVADHLYAYVTKTPGYFDTQIVYVGALGQGARRSFALGLMDSDGAQRRYLRRFNTLLKTPFYDVKNGRVFYIRNKLRDHQQVFELDLYWDQEYTLRVKGDVFSLRPVEGTDYLALSVRHRATRGYAKDRSSVGLLNVSSGKFLEVVAPAPYIFASATGQALQQAVVFNSDHKGTPQLYVTGMSGGKLWRLSREKGRYYSPMCSSRNKKIVFMKRDENGFNIGIMSPSGLHEKVVGTFYWAESPCWSPEGNAVVFVASHAPRQPPQLHRIDMNSLKLHCIKTPDEAMEPFWARCK